MSEIVECGICGKSFNKRYVNSHKRLAHKKKPNPDSPAKNEGEVMEEILHLYESLSDEKEKNCKSG
jgi:hypothetical protein